MYTIVGIIGAILILLGFYRVTIGQWTGKTFWYELDNLVGACLIGIYQVNHKAYVSVVINIVWAVVAIKGLSSYAERRFKARNK
jgi:hypothetical protein